jgi:hypothetical protein
MSLRCLNCGVQVAHVLAFARIRTLLERLGCPVTLQNYAAPREISLPVMRCTRGSSTTCAATNQTCSSFRRITSLISKSFVPWSVPVGAAFDLTRSAPHEVSRYAGR